ALEGAGADGGERQAHQARAGGGGRGGRRGAVPLPRPRRLPARGRPRRHGTPGTALPRRGARRRAHAHPRGPFQPRPPGRSRRRAEGPAALHGGRGGERVRAHRPAGRVPVRTAPARALRLLAEHVRGHHAGVREEGRGYGGHGGPELPARVLHRAGEPPREPRAPDLRQAAREAGGGVPASAALGGGGAVSQDPDRAGGSAAAALSPEAMSEWAQLGVATVYEASGRQGLVDVELTQLVPGSRVAGPALPVMCGQDDNLMVHACIERISPGDVVVVTMPEPAPVALVGELLATQMKLRGAAGLLVDASVRDFEELVALGMPVWTRWVRVRGAGKSAVGTVG